MAPVAAPAGTVAVICDSESMVKLAGLSLKRTCVTLVKFDPVMVTLAPASPLAGSNV